MMINTAINRLDQQFIPGTNRTGAPRSTGRVIQTSGTDILEISAEARERLAEKNGSPLVKSVLNVTPGTGLLVEASEKIYDSVRNGKVNSIRRSIENGTYDIDSIAGSSRLVDAVRQIAR